MIFLSRSAGNGYPFPGVLDQNWWQLEQMLSKKYISEKYSVDNISILRAWTISAAFKLILLSIYMIWHKFKIWILIQFISLHAIQGNI